MKTHQVQKIWVQYAVTILLGFGLTASVKAALVTYADNFTLTEGNLPYGQSYDTLPTNVPPSGTTALQWTDTTRPNFPGKFKIEDVGGSHGGVLGADNSETKQMCNYATNLDLSEGVPFDNGSGNNLLWSIAFDLYRYNATSLPFSIFANYDDATGNGLAINFQFNNGITTISQNGVASASLGNPGLILGNDSWASFAFERYDDGTLRIVKLSGGGATPLDATVSLTDIDYTTGGTVALYFLANTNTQNPLYMDNLAVTMNVIPEPSSAVLFGIGSIGMLCLLRRNRITR